MAKVTGKALKPVYHAAEAFVARVLRTRDSLFTPGHDVWAERHLEDLRERFVEHPDTSDSSFESKFERQLAGSPPETIQLAAELLFVHLLPANTTGAAQKRRLVSRVLGWSPTPVPIPPELDAALEAGLAAEGMAFRIARPFLLHYLVEFVRSWWRLSDADRETALRDPWAFKDRAWAVNVQKSQSQREILLHLVHPDSFEPMMSRDHKRKIADAFAELADDETDIDRRLLQIRRALETQEGRVISFYEPKYLGVWQPESDPWGQFVRFAGMFYKVPAFDASERDYKLELAEQARPVLDGLSAAQSDSVDALRRLFRDPKQNLVRWQDFEPFLEWYATALPESHQATLTARDAARPVAERMRGLLERVPSSVVKGPAARTTLASFFLFVDEPTSLIPFRSRPFDWACRQVAYPRLAEGADPADRYVHALDFADRVLNEASQRGLKLRDRLDVQALVWTMAKYKDRPDWVGPQDWEEFVGYRSGRPWSPSEDADDEAETDDTSRPGNKLSLESDPVGRLLLRRKNVVLFGPPGTGKTRASLSLAEKWRQVHGPDAVLQVTFHPTFAYEDFVEGFRPDASGRFECREGIFLQACERAAKDAQRDVLLVIDELNRGDVARIFGELITLIEADKRHQGASRQLPYSQREFWVPPNLHLLGTMNTADRSISLLDVAVRRRFCFVEFRPDSRVIGNSTAHKGHVGDVALGELMDSVNRRLHAEGIDRDRAIGHSYFLIAVTEKEPHRILVERFRHDIIPLVEEYCFANRSVIRKVLQRLVTEDGSVNEDVLSDEAAFTAALSEIANDDLP